MNIFSTLSLQTVKSPLRHWHRWVIPYVRRYSRSWEKERHQ